MSIGPWLCQPTEWGYPDSLARRWPDKRAKEERMLKRFVPRALVGMIAAASLGLGAATPALAYGQANWQLTFSGTGPGFGFWGWCDLAGATSFNNAGLAIQGNSGDCQFAEYFHNVTGFPSGTCG